VAPSAACDSGSIDALPLQPARFAAGADIAPAALAALTKLRENSARHLTINSIFDITMKKPRRATRQPRANNENCPVVGLRTISPNYSEWSVPVAPGVDVAGGYMTESRVNRRKILAAGLALPALGAPRIIFGAQRPSRELTFYHTHTGETLDIVYREGDEYLPHALAGIDRFLRDFRTGETHPIDPALLDQLADIRGLLGTAGRVEIISAYRSPRTNAMLAGKSGGVATRSLHMQGRALDIRLTGVPTANLRAAALELERGGVGYYPNSRFVHIDTGRVRRW
jgi:uncharacterized protein YcbK (DUF882 family)